MKQWPGGSVIGPGGLRPSGRGGADEDGAGGGPNVAAIAPDDCGRYSRPMRLGGQYVAKALPMIQSRGIGPQKRLSSEAPRLSPIMK